MKKSVRVKMPEPLYFRNHQMLVRFEKENRNYFWATFLGKEEERDGSNVWRNVASLDPYDAERLVDGLKQFVKYYKQSEKRKKQ